MTHAIISGGAGFIGSNFTHSAVQENWFDEITIIDKLTYASNKKYIPDVDNVNTLFIDIADTPLEVLESADYFYNFAAETHVDRSIESSIIFSESNILSLHRLIENIRNKSIDIKFIQISTDEVYGPIDHGSFSEVDKLNPRNPYSASKAGAEHLLNSYQETYGMKFVITRSSNNYGPRQYNEKLLPKMILNFMNKRSIGLYGDGKQIRDWTYVDDNSHGVYLLSTMGNIGEIYNISANNEMENIEICNLVAKIMNQNFSHVKYIKDRLGHDFRYSINTDKIRALGWRPKTKLEDGLRKTINWYRENQDLYSVSQN